MGLEHPLPDWMASAIRRAAFLSFLEWAWPMAMVCLLIAGIGFVLWLGETRSPGPLVFSLVMFGGILALFGQEAFPHLAVLLAPERSPELAYLRRFGSLAQVLSEVNGELANPAVARFGPEAAVTGRWLVVSGGRRFAVRRLADLVWAFPKDEEVHLHPHIAITVRRVPFAEFRCAAGGDCKARCSAQDARRLFDLLARRCPGIVLGWSQETQRAWDGDRDGFVAGVLEEREAS
ncbi:MAG: hypothetical protein HY927_05430 [Elusimicrobia bacterium]|nr:hypothetical protein [Elusimicrobiota bacterium]